MLISVDTEASGQCPLQGDLISFGMVVINDMTKTFLSPNMKPSCEKFDDGAYASIGMTREDHLSSLATLDEGILSMERWLKSLGHDGRFVMVTDNPAFDFQWIAFECYRVLGYNPFGHSARRIGDAWAGIKRNKKNTSSWKKFRKTKHTHNPLDDAMGNAEAWNTMWEKVANNEV